MKKLVSLLLAVCMLATLCVMLIACGHEHDWATDWSKDATHHWHACKGEDCTEVADKAEHTWGYDYKCTVCGADKDVVTTVTDEQWLAAMDLGSNYVISASQTFPGQGTEKYTDQRNGDKLQSYYEQIVNDQVADSNYNYAEIVGDVCYEYTPSYSNEDVLQGYRKEVAEGTVAENLAKVLGTYLPGDLATKSNYTYNETTKRYEAGELTIYGATVTGAYITFADGKLASFGYTVNTQGMQLVTVGAVTYGNAATITLPSGNQLLSY